MNETTPYDNVYKTLCVDCPKLLIPMVNEAFHENYTGEEEVVIGNETHFTQQPDGESEKRLTDSHFTILGKEKMGRYHIESQSSEDNTMQIRMYEYDTQIALEHAEITKTGITLEFPKAAVIYLRSSKNTPDNLQVTIKVPGGKLTYDVPIIKLSSYTMEELFEKKLFFLVPFHIFVYENQFSVYNKDEEKLAELKAVYQNIAVRLAELSILGELDEYSRHCIMDMSRRVADSLAVKHEQVRKGIGEIMGGKVLDYEAKRIYNAGKAEGRSEGWNAGRSEGALTFCVSLMKDGIISLAEAAKRLGLSESELQKHL